MNGCIVYAMKPRPICALSQSVDKKNYHNSPITTNHNCHKVCWSYALHGAVWLSMCFVLKCVNTNFEKCYVRVTCDKQREKEKREIHFYKSSNLVETHFLFLLISHYQVLISPPSATLSLLLHLFSREANSSRIFGFDKLYLSTCFSNIHDWISY